MTTDGPAVDRVFARSPDRKVTKFIGFVRAVRVSRGHVQIVSTSPPNGVAICVGHNDSSTSLADGTCPAAYAPNEEVRKERCTGSKSCEYDIVGITLVLVWWL